MSYGATIDLNAFGASAVVERVFSKTGYIVDDLRANMTGPHVEMLTCSHANFDLLVKGYVKATGRVDSAATKKDLNKYLRYLQRASSTNKGSRASAAAASNNK